MAVKKFTKREIFRQELFSIAIECINWEQETGVPTGHTRYIMADVSERTEKTFCKEQVDSLKTAIRIDKKLNRDTRRAEKMLDICEKRIEAIDQKW
jgi:hypothetical protein